MRSSLSQCKVSATSAGGFQSCELSDGCRIRSNRPCICTDRLMCPSPTVHKETDLKREIQAEQVQLNSRFPAQTRSFRLKLEVSGSNSKFPARTTSLVVFDFLWRFLFISCVSFHLWWLLLTLPSGCNVLFTRFNRLWFVLRQKSADTKKKQVVSKRICGEKKVTAEGSHIS